VTYQFNITFNEDHARYAVRKFFQRYVGLGLPIVFALLTFALVQMFTTGRTDWLFGALLVVLVVGAGSFVVAYFMRLNHAIGLLRKMGSPIVSYELTEERVKASSRLGTTEVKWEMFKELWIFPRAWLLLFDKTGYFTLPYDQLSEDVKAFLKQRVTTVGGKIK
jgi:YcxB-like protein